MLIKKKKNSTAFQIHLAHYCTLIVYQHHFEEGVLIIYV